jgi:hypothetical protein
MDLPPRRLESSTNGVEAVRASPPGFAEGNYAAVRLLTRRPRATRAGTFAVNSSAARMVRSGSLETLSTCSGTEAAGYTG